MPEATIKISGPIFRNSDGTISHAIQGLPSPTTCSNDELSYKFSPIDDFDSFLRNGTNKVTEHYHPEIQEIQLERISALKPGQTVCPLKKEEELHQGSKDYMPMSHV
jgi:DNA (cytosine-5)-methyltransferase 1